MGCRTIPSRAPSWYYAIGTKLQTLGNDTPDQGQESERGSQHVATPKGSNSSVCFPEREDETEARVISYKNRSERVLANNERGFQRREMHKNSGGRLVIRSMLTGKCMA